MEFEFHFSKAHIKGGIPKLKELYTLFAELNVYHIYNVSFLVAMDANMVNLHWQRVLVCSDFF